MQENSWIPLFRRLPPSVQDGLTLILGTGAEIVLNKVVKLEPDFIIMRGRMAGTQDNGRVLVLPYHQLVALAVTKKMTEPEIDALFGTDGTTCAAELPPMPERATSEEGEEAGDGQEATGLTVSGSSAGVNPSTPKPNLPTKAELLAKLRTRLNESSGQPQR